MNSDPFEAERRRMVRELGSYQAGVDEAVAEFAANLKEQRQHLEEIYVHHSALRPEIHIVSDALDGLERSFDRQIQEALSLFKSGIEQRLQSIDAAQRRGAAGPPPAL